MYTKSMKVCNKCGRNRRNCDFYSNWKRCKDCIALERKRPKLHGKTYKDYLRESGMSDYYERSMRYRNDTARKLYTGK